MLAKIEQAPLNKTTHMTSLGGGNVPLDGVAEYHNEERGGRGKKERRAERDLYSSSLSLSLLINAKHA